MSGFSPNPSAPVTPEALLIELDQWHQYDTGRLPGLAASRIRELESALAQEHAAKVAAEAVIAQVREWRTTYGPKRLDAILATADDER